MIFVAKTEGLPGERNDRVVFAATTPNSEEVGKPSVREVSFYLKKKDQEKSRKTKERKKETKKTRRQKRNQGG